MPLIHHVVTGNAGPPIVFVHGFACAHDDWDAQIAHLSPRHRTVAIDLRGHGASLGDAEDCSIERYGADVADLLRALALPPAVVVGHSMGCRVAIEVALQAPSLTAGLILVDGSQFSPAMEPVLMERFASEEGYRAITGAMFADMFTPKSKPEVVRSVVERALRLPRPVGQRMLSDLLRYDVWRLASSLAALEAARTPVLTVQTTYSNERRQRMTMREGQTSPYLDFLRTYLPSARIAVIAETGHFPQLDESVQTNALIDDFMAAATGG